MPRPPCRGLLTPMAFGRTKGGGGTTQRESNTGLVPSPSRLPRRSGPSTLPNASVKDRLPTPVNAISGGEGRAARRTHLDREQQERAERPDPRATSLSIRREPPSCGCVGLHRLDAMPFRLPTMILAYSLLAVTGGSSCCCGQATTHVGPPGPAVVLTVLSVTVGGYWTRPQAHRVRYLELRRQLVSLGERGRCFRRAVTIRPEPGEVAGGGVQVPSDTTSLLVSLGVVGSLSDRMARPQ